MFYTLSLIMAALTVITSSGMSFSVMRCHVSGKTSFNDTCAAHQADGKSGAAIIHQNCCDFGSYELNIELNKEKELQFSTVFLPVLYELNSIVNFDADINTFKLVRFVFLRPPPALAQLQVFII